MTDVCCTGTDKSLQGLAFPVQYRVTEVGPPVRYRFQNCGDWCVLPVLPIPGELADFADEYY